MLDAKSTGIKLFLSNGKLIAKGEKGRLSESLREKIKVNKQALIDFLSENPKFFDIEAEGEGAKYVPWLSYAQQRLWFLDKLGGSSVQYNIPGRFQIFESINVPAFEKALNELIERHEVLRTHFSELNGEPRQVIVCEYVLPFKFHDLEKLSDESKSKEINRLIELEATTPFDLSKDLMLRVQLIKVGPKHFIVLYTQHHIASDGWSMRILQNELSSLYQAYRDGKPNPLEPLRIQYADYALWQKQWLEGSVLQEQKKYWLEQLSGIPNLHRLPLDKPRPLQQTYDASRFSQDIERSLSKQIIDFCKKHDITLYIFLQTIFAIIVARFSNEKDVVIGTPISGRTHNDVEGLIGFFVNSLVLRSNLKDNLSFMSFLAKNKETILDAFTNQHIPFEMLVENIRPERDLSYNPIFQILFVVQNNERGSWQSGEVVAEGKGTLKKGSPSNSHFAKTRFDLELHVNESDAGISLRWVYNLKLFDSCSIENLSNSFCTLIENVFRDCSRIKTKHAGIHELSLLSKSKELNTLYHWNDTDADYDRSIALHQLIELQASKNPNSIAVIDNDNEITFKTLNQEANRLANYLVVHGVKQSDVIGLCIHRSIDMVVAIFAILKAGAAYVPIDPQTPKSRIKFVLKDSGANIVIGNNATLALFTDLNINYLALDDHHSRSELTKFSHELAFADRSSSNLLAYIIYTSGSTGTPKGVMVNHRNVINYIQHGKSYLTENIVGAVVTTALVFDATVCSLFIPLCYGKYIELLDDDSASIDSLIDCIVDDSDDLLFKLTPSHLKAVLSNDLLETNVKSEHVFVVGGEQLTTETASQWFDKFPLCSIINEYGPTETTVGCCIHTCEKQAFSKPLLREQNSVSIGNPINNTQLYVLNAHLQPQPDGVVGELYIGGDGVSNGYINQASLTARKFIPNPYAKRKGSRLYKTGDLVKRCHNGQLEFVKRVDEQVKVRGFRIELGDIECSISEHTDISSNAVIASGDGDSNQQLIAYLCPSNEYLEKTSKETIKDNVNQWTEVFNDTYNEDDVPVIEANYSGWDSSYTMQAIEIEQMDEWLDATISVIQSLRPRNLLEIGCGTGLLLFRYASSCESVTAVDISKEALANVSKGISAKDWKHIELIQGDALSISESFHNRQFDCIVINSVAQYFPNRLYFETVLNNALSVLCEGGKLLLGDIRNLDLFTSHVCAVEQSRLTQSTTLSVFSNRVQRRIQQEQELLVSPSYFGNLKARFNTIAQVDIMVKRGVGDNEMNRYRYEVVITKKSKDANQDSRQQVEWQNFTSRSDFEALICNLDDHVAAISGIPNPRLDEDFALCLGLKNWQSSRLIHPQASAGKLSLTTQEKIDWLESQFRLAEDKGYKIAVTWSQSAKDKLDVIISRDSLPEVLARSEYKESYLINYPRLDKIGSGLSKSVANHLLEKLPSYMLPSFFVVLEKLPLTINGKVNKKVLPLPNETDIQKEKYVPPSNEVEQSLCEIWQNILNISKVGIHDNFFSLGGHSLLATRLISAIRQQFAAEIQIRMLFEAPTVATLAEVITSLQGEFVLPNLEKVERKGQLPLSYAQQRLWFVDQLGEGSTEYNMRGRFTIEKDFNQSAFYNALEYLIKRHEILRTTYLSVDGQPVQKILEQYEIPYQYFDLSRFKSDDINIKLNEISSQEANQPFQLDSDLMIRVKVAKLSQSLHSIFYTIHHIAGDAWSIDIFKRELSILYDAFNEKKQSPLQAIAYQYVDYAAWQKKWLSGAVLESQLEFWKSNLNELPTVHSLPLDKKRPNKQTNSGRGFKQTINPNLVDKIKKHTKAQGVTLFMFLQTAFSVLLSRYSNQSDIVMGTPVSGRIHKDIENLIGFFVNTLVLRTDLSGEPNFLELLSKNKQMILDAYAHQHIPFEMLVDEVLDERNITYNALFQILFDVQTESVVSAQSKVKANDKKEPIKVINEIGVRFDLAIHVKDSADGLSVRWSYRDSLFEDESILRMVKNYECLLEKIVESLESGGESCRVHEVEFITKQEKNIQLLNWNNNKADYPLKSCIHELIEEQVIKSPNNIAVICEEQELTYEEFNHQANQLANLLLQSGVSHGAKVVIFIDRSVEAMIALLAVLKSGAAYVPIDSTYPRDRIEYMLENCNAACIITKHKFVKTIFEDYFTICLDDSNTLDQLKGLSAENISRDVINLNSHQPAYVIYTSGSTGKPKGVVVNHRSVVNFLFAIKEPFFIEQLSGSIVSSPLAFDATVQSLYLPLCVGKYVEIIPEDENLIESLADYLIDDEERLLFKITPTHLKAVSDIGFLSTNSSANHVIVVAGEKLTCSTVLPWVNEILPNSIFINEYGPTEATVGSCIYQISGHEEETKNYHSVPIGSPLSNVNFYVLDKYQNLQPIGVPGELYISGEGLADGYLNMPEVTNEKFIDNPFGRDFSPKMYKTGDLVRWTNQGDIEFLSRVDDQVKLRGFRIELGEIEYLLNQLDDINNSVVVVKETELEQEVLVAYLVSNNPPNQKNHQVSNIKRYLASKLPDFMVPSFFVYLDKLPLTPSGKIAKADLPNPGQDSVEQLEYQAPRNRLEEKLCTLWAKILGVTAVGINDNFFTLGGHSLLATRLISLIREELQREVQLRTLFEYPTIAGLSEKLNLEKDNFVLPKIEVCDRTSRIPLSFAQQRLWFIDKLGGSLQYNMPGRYLLSGKFDLDIFKEALAQLIDRHEILRTVIKDYEGTPFQFIQNSYELPISLIDCSQFLDDERQNKVFKLIQDEAKTPFDLANDMVLRVKVLKIADDMHLILYTLHHIASDGWSMAIFQNELSDIYASLTNGKESTLLPLKRQYADYSVWQREWLTDELLEDQLNYWRQQLSDIPDVHKLPLDKERPSEQSFNGMRFMTRLDGKAVKIVKAFCEDKNITLFIFLQSVFAILLSKYSGCSRIVMGTPVAGRLHKDLEGLIGFFVNTLVLKSNIYGDDNFFEFLELNKNTILDAYSNQHIAFESLVEELKPSRSLSYNPLFQIMFSVQNNETGVLDLEYENDDSYKVRSKSSNRQEIEFKNCTTRFDLELRAKEFDEGIDLNWSFNTSLFNKGNVSRLSEYFSFVFTKIAHEIESLDLDESLLIKDILLPEASGLWDKRRSITEMQASNNKKIKLYERFELLVREKPQEVFLSHKRKSISIKQIDYFAAALCAHLVNFNPNQHRPVAILCHEPIAKVISTLAVLRSGLTILLIDHRYSKFKAASLLELSNSQLVISQGRLGSELIELLATDIKAIELNDDGSVSSDLKPINTSEKANSPGSDVALTLISEEPEGLPRFIPMSHEYLSHMLKTKNILDNPASLVLNSINLSQYTAILKSIYDGKWQAGEAKTKRLKPADIKNKKFTLGDNGFNGIVVNKDCRPQAMGAIGNLLLDDSLLIENFKRQCVAVDCDLPDTDSKSNLFYKTPYLARYTDVNHIEVLGLEAKTIPNLDRDQLEVELMRCLASLDQVKNSAIRWSGNNDFAYICFCEVVEQVSTLDGKDANSIILDSLRNLESLVKLPDFIVFVESIRLENNGKVDYSMLPSYEDVKRKKSVRLPTNSLQKRMCVIWQNLLDVNRVGVDENFFKIGGHSLLATRLISQIREAFNAEVSIKDLFDNATIESLCLVIENATKETGKSQLIKVSRQQKLPLSYAQQRLWFIDQLGEGSSQYNIKGRFNIKGQFRLEIFQRALDAIINRHEVLRTTFEESDDGTIQVINEKFESPLSFHNLSSYSKDERTHQIHQYIAQEEMTPFNLRQDVMVRARVLQLSDEEVVILYTMHHIASDGWSKKIFQDELYENYQAFLQNKPSPFVPLDIQYADYSIWQKQCLQGEKLKKQLSYWKHNLSGIPKQHNLPLDFNRPQQQTHAGELIYHVLDKKIAKDIDELCKQKDVTLFIFLQTVYALFLSRYSFSNDIVVGVPVAGRDYFELEPLIGFFINTLLIRTKISDSETFDSLLARNKVSVLDALNNQDVPFEMLVDALQPERNLALSPLTQLYFSVQNIELGKIDQVLQSRKSNQQLTPVYAGNSSVRFDLEFTVTPKTDTLGLCWGYNKSLFKRQSIVTMAQRFTHFVGEIVNSLLNNNHCAKPATSYMLEPSSEFKPNEEVLSDKSGNVSYLNESLDQLAEIAKLKPHEIAIREASSQATFSQLANRVDSLANLLKSYGVKVESKVGVLVNTRMDFLISALAVIKCGACVVSIKPEYPSSKKAYIFETSQISLLITDSKTQRFVEESFCKHDFIKLIDIQKAFSQSNEVQVIDNHNYNNYAKASAIITYNEESFSTSLGHITNYKSLAKQMKRLVDSFSQIDVNQIEKMSSPSVEFDLGSMFAALMSGKCICFKMNRPATMIEGDWNSVHDVVFNPKQKHALESDAGNSQLVVVDEPLIASKNEILRSIDGIKRNKLPSSKRYSVSENDAYILDRNGCSVPEGTYGELYIEDSQDAFCLNISSARAASIYRPNASADIPGSVLFKTSMLARKIDKNLIEVGSPSVTKNVSHDCKRVTRYLSDSCLDIEETIAININNKTSTYDLYFCTKNKEELGDSVNKGRFNNQIQESLRNDISLNPLPRNICQIDAIPRLDNGDLDVNEITKLSDFENSNRYKGASSDLEKELVKIWSEVLNINLIGVDENFFDAGGNSLLATKLINKIRAKYKIEFPLRALFEDPTIELIAKRIFLEQSSSQIEKNVEALNSANIDIEEGTL
ncbi:amino acid adenylation domain-containing protein [Aliikangiella marina]|uniref:Amino acid adenylation domain-containing protein n=1 Tax=Aliikangiella marina TaxID=1712262 RepID=A0A545TJG5_9GAMM|nr:non-ribosomal peptide synthetase [Aliikangiella marina]TQV77374.1 amino acid adenylation domain-containing protein [Aliikangiella marina]